MTPTISKEDALAGMTRIAADPKLDILTTVGATIEFLRNNGWVMTYDGLKPLDEWNASDKPDPTV